MTTNLYNWDAKKALSEMREIQTRFNDHKISLETAYSEMQKIQRNIPAELRRGSIGGPKTQAAREINEFFKTILTMMKNQKQHKDHYVQSVIAKSTKEDQFAKFYADKLYRNPEMKQFIESPSQKKNAEKLQNLVVDQLIEASRFAFLSTNRELFATGKSKDYKESKPPCAKHHDLVGIHVIDDVLKQPTPELQSQMMERWIQIMNQCYEKRDFLTASAIHSAFSSNALNKLIKDSHCTLSEECKKSISSESRRKKFRADVLLAEIKKDKDAIPLPSTIAAYHEKDNFSEKKETIDSYLVLYDQQKSRKASSKTPFQAVSKQYERFESSVKDSKSIEKCFKDLQSRAEKNIESFAAADKTPKPEKKSIMDRLKNWRQSESAEGIESKSSIRRKMS